jgi:hypothetical protein
MNMKKLLRYAFIPLIAVSILGCPLAIQRGDNEAQTLVDANGLPITVLKKDYNDGTGYTVTKNPLFEQRNSSDPALYVTHQMDVEKDVLMMVTSCDLNTANNPGGTYPMDKTYLYVTSTQEDPMLKWYDHGAILQESDLPWADNLDCVWAPDLISMSRPKRVVFRKSGSPPRTKRARDCMIHSRPCRSLSISKALLPTEGFPTIRGSFTIIGTASGTCPTAMETMTAGE